MEEESSNMIDLHTLTTEKLLEKAETAFSEMSFESAKVFYQEAYSKDPNNEDLLCSYANFLTNIDEISLARKLLRQALEVNIEKSCNYKKFVQMAELVSGKLSVQLYEKAIEIIERLYNPIVDNDPTQQEIKRDLALAYSALAETYQTDLLQEKESELLCRENIEKALKIDEFCLDAYLQYANFFLNKEDVAQAKHWLKLLVNEIKKTENEEIANNLQQNNEKSVEIEEEKANFSTKAQTNSTKKQTKNDNIVDLYPLSFKLNVIRLLIEVEEWQESVELIEQYREEDEDNAEILYLQAFCLFKLKDYTKIGDLIEELDKKDLSFDNEIESAYKELKEELIKILGPDFLQINKNNQENEEICSGEDEGEWMDIE